MNTKLTTKVLSAILAFILSFANVALLLPYVNTTYAAENLEKQDTVVNKAEIEFDAYFQEDGAKKHSKALNIEEKENELYLGLKVGAGYLTNAKIKIEDANFKLKAPTNKTSIIQSINSDTNEILLNQISTDESVVLNVPIEIKADSNFVASNLSKVANVKLEGIYTNNKGKEVKIEKAIEIETTIDGTAESILEGEVTKYVAFDQNGERGLILQTLIKSKLIENKLPVKQTKIEIEVPEINNIEPKTIALSSKTLMATKGQTGKVFVKDEDYKIENRKIVLTIKNEEDTLAWEKNASDEIILTCIYEEEAIREQNKINLNAKSQITYYAKEQKTAEKSLNKEIVLQEQIGDIITVDTETSENVLYKGYMQTANSKNTPYTSKVSMNIGYKEIVDKIMLQDETKYVDNNGNEYPASIIYTYTKIEKDNLLEILGEDGYINIYSKDKKLISTINKENLEYKYEEEVSGLIFETSKPISEGILKLENGREIKPLEYSKAQEEAFTMLKETAVANVIKSDTIVIRSIEIANIELKAPETKAKLEIVNPNISTVVENKNIELRATLNTTEADSALYKNPEIEIVMPTYITDLKISSARLAYENELKKADAKIYRNGNGNIVMKLAFVGEQTKYNEEAIAEGATISIKADMKSNPLTPTRETDVVLNVKNEKTKETITETATMNFLAPAGIVTVNQMTGYNEAGEKATSISGKKELGEIAVNSVARTAKVNMTIINNYDYGCENIKILGRTPFKGNKGVKSGQDLGSTFTAKMQSQITASGIDGSKVTVYYSTNENASKDLSNTVNGWTTNPSNLEEVKSYMIVLNAHTINTGDMIGFSYDVEIPANLEYNQETYGTFAVYYTRASEEGIAVVNEYEESLEGAVVGLTTGEGPNLEVGLEADIENNAGIIERDNITYKVNVKNNAELTARNVNVKVELPKNAFYVNEGKVDTINKTINMKIAEIPAGETKNVSFVLKAGAYNSDSIFNKGEPIDTNVEMVDSNSIKIKAVATVEGYVSEFASNERTNKIVSALTNPRITMNFVDYLGNKGTPGVEMLISAGISKNTTEDLHNVVVKCKIPEGLKLTKLDDEANNYEYDSKTNTLIWNVGTLGDHEALSFWAELQEIPGAKYPVDIPVVYTATCDETSAEQKSEPYSIQLFKEVYSISQTSNISGEYISKGETVIYSITVTNETNAESDITVKDILPNGLKFEKCFYTQNGQTVTRTKASSSTIIEPVRLKGGETLTINIQAKAKEYPQNTQITNKVFVVTNKYEEIAGNELTHTILGVKAEKPNPDDPSNPDDPTVDTQKYTISGTAWIDTNKNGTKEDGEKLLSGIKVYLLNSKNNNIVKTVETNTNGLYTFQDVPKGSYIIVFEYDTNKYEIAPNTDIFAMQLKLNGKQGTYGATNVINLENNTHNINLGLVESNKFDLKLEKVIDLVQVSNQKGTKTYNFKSTDLAKIEIPEKQMKGSVVAVTYTMKVTNEGTVAGYANKIIDYKAKDLNFSSTLNPEWYQDVSGNLYNSTLSSRLIKPGETVEVSLILTKTMTTENTGLSSNSAEIAEASNDQGIQDIDSTPGNKNTSEDDYSTADLIVIVQTGGILFYGGIVLAVLGIFALGAYIINKKVLMRV